MLNLELAWDRPARVRDGEQRHVLRVRILPAASNKSLTLHMALLLDTSGSMDGPKLQHAKEACVAAAALTRPQDRLWLAGFSGDVRPILSGETGGPELADRTRAAIAALRANGVTRTDLALAWIQSSLKPEPNTFRAGVLVTDGHPTDPTGETLKEERLNPLLQQATDAREKGITLYALGMGDAKHFNTAFLVDLANHGRGKFIPASDPAELQDGLRSCLETGVRVVVPQAKLTARALRAGVEIDRACRFRPTFVALDGAGDSSTMEWNIGALTTDEPNDLLIEIKTGGLGFGEPLGQYDVLEVTVDGGDASAVARAAIEWTNSFMSAQILNRDVDEDRLMWENNLYAELLNRTEDPVRHTQYLKQMQSNAQIAGRQDIVDRVTRDLELLQQQGVLSPDRRTKTLEQMRKPGGTS